MDTRSEIDNDDDILTVNPAISPTSCSDGTRAVCLHLISYLNNNIIVVAFIISKTYQLKEKKCYFCQHYNCDYVCILNYKSFRI